MASHTEIKVGDTDWVIRIAGADVQVKVLEKTKKASGRGYEFRCKRFENGRSVGRNLVRGSGALRRPGQAPKSNGFAKSSQNPLPAPPAPTPRRARAKPKPRPRPRATPPASAFFSEVQEPGARASGASPASGLGSLRGRRSSKPAPSPRADKTTSPSAARREIERQLKHADLSPLVVNLVKKLIHCDGTELATGNAYGIVMSEHRLGRSFSFRR